MDLLHVQSKWTVADLENAERRRRTIQLPERVGSDLLSQRIGISFTMPTHLLTRIFGECRRPAVRRVLFHPESICSDGRIGPWLMTDFFPSEGSPSPRTIGPLDSPTRLARHQFPQQDPNHFWPMLADRPFESVRAFKSIRPSNLHLPLIVRLRTYNRNPPIPRSICKHVLDSCNHFPLQSRITRILHLHRKGHDIALLSILLAVEQTTARAHPDRACGNTARPKKHSVAAADQILVPSDVSRPHPHPPHKR